MANSRSAKKRILVSEKKSVQNRIIKSRTRTAVKKADAVALAGGKEAEAAVRSAVSLIDKAVTKGVIHKNTAARRKSRLAKMLNKTAV